MKMKVRLLIVFLTGVLIGSIALLVTVQGGQRSNISEGERADARWEVQNVMSKHAYYKQINQHCEELVDIWVSENGPYGKTAKWTSKYGAEVGIAHYVTEKIPDLYAWNPTTVPRIFPEFPEPYYTFSETFSY